MPASSIDLSMLTEFALGKLSAETTAKVICELERNPQLSRDLEVVLQIIAHLEEPRRHPSLAEYGESRSRPQSQR